MSTEKKIKGGILAIVGYILSPLSWWNDIFVNLPIAYAIGFLFGLIAKPLFFPFLVIGYWLTNIIGLILLHGGVTRLVSKSQNNGHLKNRIIKDVIISLLYTSVIIILVATGVLRFPTEYLSK